MLGALPQGGDEFDQGTGESDFTPAVGRSDDQPGFGLWNRRIRVAVSTVDLGTSAGNGLDGRPDQRRSRFFGFPSYAFECG